MQRMIAALAFASVLLGLPEPGRGQLLDPLVSYCNLKRASLEKSTLKKACLCDIKWLLSPLPSRDPDLDYCLYGVSLTGKPVGARPKFEYKLDKLDTKAMVTFLFPCPLATGYEDAFWDVAINTVARCCHTLADLSANGCIYQ